MWNIHGETTDQNIDLNPAVIGDQTLVAANTAGETFIHAFSIIVDGACVILIKKGSTTVATFKMAANQTISLSDIPGMEGEPFYRLDKNIAFVLNSDAAVRITGTLKRSIKN